VTTLVPGREAREQVVWICRHGNRVDFVDPSWRERNGDDPHLSEDGVQQARETGERLRNEGIRHIFASPFLRTVETAHYIAEILDLRVSIEHGACEWLNPAWFAQAPVTLPAEEMAERFPRVDPEYTPVVIPRYPETAEEAFLRAGRAARLLAERNPGDLLLVGHGHSVVGMSWGLLGTRPDIHTGLCGLVKVERRGGSWRLALNGDTSHLSGGERGPRRLH
jgi:broad specificity phosphatase PhoE